MKYMGGKFFYVKRFQKEQICPFVHKFDLKKIY